MTTKLMNIKETCAAVQLSRVTIWRLVRKGQFPKPIHLSERSRAWREDEINIWIEQRSEARA